MRRIGLAVVLAHIILAPIAVEAQQPTKVARIGYVSFRSGPSYLDEAFRQGLRDLGYVEGQNISVEYRWADWKLDQVPALAAELVRLKVDLIVSTGGNATARAVKTAVTTIPVVFVAGDIAELVARLDRPGGKYTGISILSTQLNVKRLELLKEAVPHVSRVAVLANPTSPTTAASLKDLEVAAEGLRVKLQVLRVREPQQFDNAFVAMSKERSGALLVMSDTMFFAQRERIVDLAAKRRLPGVFEWREFAEAGGLLSYGTNIADIYRHVATYVDKILKGANPADLPVEQPTKFELVINMKTAKAMGLTIPQTLLLRADQLIE